jgi:very-short-patch-repair endonuclease
MRHQILKLQRGKSTKAERVFAETLKSMRIPFRAKVKIDGMEIDFIVKDRAIEINGHAQDEERNLKLVKLGFTPIHLHNSEVLKNQDLLRNFISKI